MALAACGSSGPSRGATGSLGFIKFAQCMRTHGVPNLPDPSSGGGGIQIAPGSGLSPASPAFKAAQQACAKLLPGGGPVKQHVSKQRLQAMVKTSECMRQHGVSGFPDPTLSPPSNIGDYREAIGRGGVFLAIPKTIDTGSPVFKEAARVCSFPG
jgi:hypothetical protein